MAGRTEEYLRSLKTSMDSTSTLLGELSDSWSRERASLQEMITGLRANLKTVEEERSKYGVVIVPPSLGAPC